MGGNSSKKSFLLYCDQLPIFESLTDKQAGVLVKEIYKYCGNGRTDPSIEDPVIKMAFTALKTSLDRDFFKWEEIRKKRAEYGKLGGRPKKA